MPPSCLLQGRCLRAERAALARRRRRASCAAQDAAPAAEPAEPEATPSGWQFCNTLLGCGSSLSISVAAGEADYALLTPFLAEALAETTGQRSLSRYLERTRVGPHVRARTSPLAVPSAAGEPLSTAERALLLQRGVLLKAELGGRLAAACELSLSEASDSTVAPPPRSCMLQNLSTAPEQRRKGIATALLSAAACFADCHDVYLHSRVEDDGSAGELYRAAGFVAVAEHSFFEGLMRSGPRLRLMRRLAERPAEL